MSQDVWGTLTIEALLERVRAAPGFQAIDRQFAVFCAEAERQAACRSAVFVVALVVSRALREGHPCIVLKDIELGPWVSGWLEATGLMEVTATLPCLLKQARSVTTLVSSEPAGSAAPALEPVVGPPLSAQAPATPLVFDGVERVYMTRYYLHEQRLAHSLTRLIDAEDHEDELKLKWLDERLQHYFPLDPAEQEPDLQRLAARNAARSRVLVVSGGPGTGKTATVAKILALLVEQAAFEARSTPRIVLLAPTGKAAARLNESIVGAIERLNLPQAMRATIAPHAMTIHRALGVRADSATRFVRGESYPLVADVVVVDEGSMVDLALMRHLCEALPGTARLLVLGDRNQLASVEAGSVFSDLCEALGQVQASRRDAQPAAVTELTKSYRFKQDSGIAALAESVRLGSWSEFSRVRHAGHSELAFYDAIDERASLRSLLSMAERQWDAAFSSASPEQALEHFARFRVLCAHREGTFGVQSLNQSIAHHLFSRGYLTSPSDLSRGQLLMILENDATLGVNNGDVFVVWPAEDGRLWACFPKGEQLARRVSLPQLPRHELCFAMTVHKSQGSEYAGVALVLPAPGSPVVTRELLYTGITRAKQHVCLFAPEPTLEEAIQKQVVRRSGLSVALRREVAVMGPRGRALD